MSKTKSKKNKPIYWKNQEPPKAGEVFTDPLFPPTVNSLLGLDSSGNPIDIETYNAKKHKIETDKISFFRAKEVLGDDYSLFGEEIEIDDVKQGNLGDCYFLTAVSNLCKFPDKVKQMFKQSSKNEKGFYEIEFYIGSIKQIVIVDDYFPTFKKIKEIAYAQPNKNKIWVMLLEKAWAKINGGYMNIISGRCFQALEFLVGRGSLFYNLANREGDDLINLKRKIIRDIQLSDKNNCLISCQTIDDESIDKVGLITHHAYSILDFCRIKTAEEKNVFLFKIRNPWAFKEWNGDWSDQSQLWDQKTKSQVHIEDKDDGIFYMNDVDFFKYFQSVEICYLFLESEEAVYEIEGEDNIKNGCVFIVETKQDGYLNVSVPKENPRIHRNIKGKNLPTFISIVKYDPSAKDRFKLFSNYNGIFEHQGDCTLNLRIAKGNYLIYVYRDFDHAEYQAEKKIYVKILCSCKFKHAQMSYDERDKGFPLLQNIIIQAAYEEYNYDVDSEKDLYMISSQINGNGIGYLMRYYSTPGYFYKFTGGIEGNINYVVISPYLDRNTKNFNKIVPSGKYFVCLGIRTSPEVSKFSIDKSCKLSSQDSVLDFDYYNNDIDLTLYTDFNNSINSPNYKEKKKKILEKEKKEYYTDTTGAKIEYKSLEELEKEYGDYIKLFDDIEIEIEDYDRYNKSHLKWGIVKNEYTIFIGQFSGEVRHGKGLYINPKNIFVGQFKNHWQFGKGYTYNNHFQKLFYYRYENGVPNGNPVIFEEELNELELKNQIKEEELKQEKERLKKYKEEQETLIKKKEKDFAKTKDEETKTQIEELKNQLKKVIDDQQKLENDINKNIKEKKMISEEKERIRQKKEQKEKEKLEKERKEENFGVQIFYPEYLQKETDFIKPKKIEGADCVSCGCNIV